MFFVLFGCGGYEAFNTLEEAIKVAEGHVADWTCYCEIVQGETIWDTDKGHVQPEG